MAAGNARELQLKWAAEITALRNECYVELKHKLLDIAQVQFTALNENRKTLHGTVEDETLRDLKQKLDAIALSGRRLSQVFMNSLVATTIHRIAAAAIQSKKKPKHAPASEESRPISPTSGCNLAISSAPASGITSQSPHRFPDTTSHHSPLSHTFTALEDGCPPARVGGGVELNLQGFLANHVLKHLLPDYRRGCSVHTELAELVQERLDLDRRVSEERNIFAKRFAYMRDCRVAAEKEKETAQKELAAAMLSLVMAEKERAVAAKSRAAALDELNNMTALCLREHSQPQRIRSGSPRLQDVEVPGEATIGYASTASAEAPRPYLSTAPSPSQPLSTCPAIPTLMPPDSPDDTESSGHPENFCFNPAATSGDICPKGVTELHANENDRDSTMIRHSDAKGEVVNIAGMLENPIGPYIRPPMPLADMLKCIRCLFGKDKSLKTGNRARVFLGVSWSEIVSFDPDILLRRGVVGIKEGSTGMASRLRMMTIIDSALSNQNNDTIPAEVWERPTHFCENCQKRYPITVNSNEAVLPFEESVQRKKDVTRSQASVEGNTKTQETSGSFNSKGKRNRKRL